MRLGSQWYGLLETTVDVVQALNRLELTVRKVEYAATYEDALYYHETWVQDFYNLCAKLRRLIACSSSLYALGKLKDKFIKEIVDGVERMVGKKRQAIVHGADEHEKGGLGINAKAVTEEQLWESQVAVGPGTIPYALATTNLEVPEWMAQIRQDTYTKLGTLGDIIARWGQEIRKVAASV